MIFELLEWAVTPCPWFARGNGLLAAQIAIRHRAKRCRAAWNGHLEACKKFVAEAVGSLPADQNLVILGSGHLNDFDPAFLLRRFQKLTLVDAVHPLEIQIRARFSSAGSEPTASVTNFLHVSRWPFQAARQRFARWRMAICAASNRFLRANHGQGVTAHSKSSRIISKGG